jgi:hypothetical protein
MIFLHQKSNTIRILTNSKVLSEGVDVPVVDMVAMCNNIKSDTDIVQRTGRAQRIDEKNPEKIATVFIPLIFNSDNHLIYGDERLLNIASGLRENDEIYTHDSRPIYNSAARGVSFIHLGKKAGVRENEVENFTGALKTLEKRVRSLFLGGFNEEALVGKIAAVKAFILEHGRLPISITLNAEEALLGRWVISQRKRYRDGKMTQDRYAKIKDAFGESFFEAVKNREVSVSVSDLISFYKENKKMPASGSKSPFESRLYALWHKLKAQKIKGQMDDEVCKNFINIFGEPFFKSKEDSFIEVVKKVAIFFKNNGFLPRQQVEDEHEGKLGSWVAATKGKLLTMSEERKEILMQHIGPVLFEVKMDVDEERWMGMYKMLVDFNKKHGENPKGSDLDSADLHMWVRSQKNRYADGKILPRRKEMLKQISSTFFMNQFEVKWEESFNKATEIFINTKEIPRSSTSEGRWMYAQRESDSLGRFMLENKARFEAVFGTEFLKPQKYHEDKEWESKLLHYSKIKPDMGGSFMYARRTDFTAWRSIQRINLSAGVLSDSRRERLLLTFGDTFFQLEDEIAISRWDEIFKEYSEYVKTRGNVTPTEEYISNSGVKLASWYRTQRRNVGLGKLDDRQKKVMGELAGESFCKTRHETWMETFADACDLYDSRMGDKELDGAIITKWLISQRINWKRDTLGKEYGEMLQSKFGNDVFDLKKLKSIIARIETVNRKDVCGVFNENTKPLFTNDTFEDGLFGGVKQQIL